MLPANYRIRLVEPLDYQAIIGICKVVYPTEEPYSLEELEDHRQVFPQGHSLQSIAAMPWPVFILLFGCACWIFTLMTPGMFLPLVVRSSITIPKGRRFTVRTSWYIPDINTTVSDTP